MFIIRDGRKDDCIAIEEMIKELAVYEKMPNGPQIDHKVLERDGFGEERLFRTLVAQMVDDKQVVGYALYFYKYSTWVGKGLWMEDLYVKPQFRKLGIGRALVTGVAKKAAQESCDRLEWNCLDWNRSSIDFYKSLGAQDLTADEGWHTFRLSKQQIKDIASESDSQ